MTSIRAFGVRDEIAQMEIEHKNHAENTSGKFSDENLMRENRKWKWIKSKSESERIEQPDDYSSQCRAVSINRTSHCLCCCCCCRSHDDVFCPTNKKRNRRRKTRAEKLSSLNSFFPPFASPPTLERFTRFFLAPRFLWPLLRDGTRWTFSRVQFMGVWDMEGTNESP